MKGRCQDGGRIGRTIVPLLPTTRDIPCLLPPGAPSAHPRCPRSSGHILLAKRAREEHLTCPRTVKTGGCGPALRQDGGVPCPIAEQSTRRPERGGPWRWRPAAGGFKGNARELEEVDERVASLEEHENARGEEVEQLQQEILWLQDQQIELQAHAEVLENRSRRNNIPIRGAPTGAKEGDILSFVQALFLQTLGKPAERERVRGCNTYVQWQLLYKRDPYTDSISPATGWTQRDSLLGHSAWHCFPYTFPMSVKLITLNVKWLKNPIKCRVIISYLENSGVDICLLQETQLVPPDEHRMRSRAFPIEHFSSSGRKVEGVAILVLHSFKRNVGDKIGEVRERLLAYRIHTGGTQMVVVSIYAPNEGKEKFILGAFAERVRDRPEVTGDRFGGEAYTITLYADDVVVTLDDPVRALPVFLEEVEAFGVVSSFRVTLLKGRR
ncbi:hypothetical protein NDU88_003838 [Pleurodeles waltl]|uniref:Endonuclease/exonuclease/phosphatase domain-containing protein n=1 Tax=Pleurodeles waltl TaxID=8319 RepID=A0AAV7WUR8_PLEWA|nr:hypothetical protein NDU88_003838 [Pleurodeles waltl]